MGKHKIERETDIEREGERKVERLIWRERERERYRGMKHIKQEKERQIQVQIQWGLKDLLWDNKNVRFEIKTERKSHKE